MIKQHPTIPDNYSTEMGRVRFFIQCCLNIEKQDLILIKCGTDISNELWDHHSTWLDVTSNIKFDLTFPQDWFYKTKGIQSIYETIKSSIIKFKITLLDI